jgi:putative oxidoreductase
MKAFFQTDDTWTGLTFRITLGLVMFPHGAQKLLGWYGGFGFSGTKGFFMNWFGKQQGEGYEYHLLVIGIGLALLMTGAGKWSVDRLIADKVDR